MSDDRSTPASTKILIPLVFAHVPLATGDSISLAGVEEEITAARVIISTANASAAMEVKLSFRFGWLVGLLDQLPGPRPGLKVHGSSPLSRTVSRARAGHF